MKINDIRPLGDQSVIVKLADSVSLEAYHKVQALYCKLQDQPILGVEAVVPAFTTITIFYSVTTLAKRFGVKTDIYQQFHMVLKEYIEKINLECFKFFGKNIEIPVCYEDDYALDLEVVAKQVNLTTDEVVHLHSSTNYHTYMLGFSPGFPFLGTLDQRLTVPRKKSPRLHVPVGSVGIAGAQTGIYSLSTPGGWQIIGCTPIKLYDFYAKRPTLIQMGDKVKFKPINKEEFLALQHKEHVDD
jgi:inhibitor of KinA